MAGLIRETKHFYEFGPFRLDPARAMLFRAGEVVSLPPKVFDILLVLVETSGETVQKDELMERVWPDSFVEEGNLSVNIFALRKALGDDGNKNLYVKTVPKRGYRFVADVRRVGSGNGEGNGELLLSAQTAPRQKVTDSGTPGVSSTTIEPEVEQRSASSVVPQEKGLARRSRAWVPAISILAIGLTATLAYFWATSSSSRPLKAQSTLRWTRKTRPSSGSRRLTL